LKSELLVFYFKAFGLTLKGENDQAQDKEKASPKQEPEKVDIPKFLVRKT